MMNSIAGEEERARPQSARVDELDASTRWKTSPPSCPTHPQRGHIDKERARDLNDAPWRRIADVTVRDVKERLVLLESPSGQLAETNYVSGC